MLFAKENAKRVIQILFNEKQESKRIEEKRIWANVKFNTANTLLATIMYWIFMEAVD